MGKHFILAVPEDLIEDAHVDRTPKFFELQIKTLFQHAWSEAEHDLAYKPSEPLTQLQRRQVAFTAAQAWGADQLFAQLHEEISEGSAAAPLLMSPAASMRRLVPADTTLPSVCENDAP